MAGTLTHAYFVEDVYKNLNTKTKELILNNDELLKTFAQSMDVLYFYNIQNLGKGKKIRDFGEYFHDNKSYEFFSTLINYIKYNNMSKNSDVITFLYGMLSHYVLDSNLHPYIVYTNGFYDKQDKSTYKYNMQHNIMENYIDSYFTYHKRNIKPRKFKCHKLCLNTSGFNSSLTEVIDFTYKEVFGIKDFHKYYLKSIKQMKFFYWMYRYDPFGYKKVVYSVFDLICPRSMLLKKPLSMNISLSEKKDIYNLNLNKNTWYNPADKNISSNESVLEIYDRSLKEVIDMIYEINEYLYNDKKIDLRKILGNKSYLSGIDCDKDRELVNFKY